MLYIASILKSAGLSAKKWNPKTFAETDHPMLCVTSYHPADESSGHVTLGRTLGCTISGICAASYCICKMTS